MRSALAAFVLVVSAAAAAQENESKPLAIEVGLLGDSQHGVVARVFFRFANPRQVTEAGLFLEGSFTQAGHVPRNFRIAVPRKGDKLIWHNYSTLNGRVLRHTQWSVLPDKRNELQIVHTFLEGEAEIEARLVLERDHDAGPVLVAAAAETFTLNKTNRPVAEEEDDIEEVPRREASGAVTFRAPKRDEDSSFVRVGVDVTPAVKRVEFRIGERKVLTRNAAPYATDLDVGDEPVVLHAVAFDEAGRYIDADALVMNEKEPRLAVAITRTATPDGMTHFKLTVRNGGQLKRVALYAGDAVLCECLAISVPTATVGTVRAVVVDEAGNEATATSAAPSPRTSWISFSS